MTITISKAQWASLGERNFERRVAELIRTQYPAQAADVSDAEMRAFTARQASTARRYGLDDELSAMTLVLTAFLLGEGYDERIPALAQVLGAPELSAATKAQALTDFTLAVFGTLEAR